jgi:hypothetical protein
MLRRHMATKKKPTPVENDAEDPVLEDVEDIEEDIDEDDLDVDLDEDDDVIDVAIVDADDELADDALVDDEADAEVSTEEIDEILTPSPAAVVERSGEEGEDEEEEEPDDEDVEASLDVILKERLVVEDEPEDEEATDAEDKTEGNERVLPKQPDEFVCRSCFLVKHPSQLADKNKMLCRDCV